MNPNDPLYSTSADRAMLDPTPKRSKKGLIIGILFVLAIGLTGASVLFNLSRKQAGSGGAGFGQLGLNGKSLPLTNSLKPTEKPGWNFGTVAGWDVNGTALDRQFTKSDQSSGVSARVVDGLKSGSDKDNTDNVIDNQVIASIRANSGNTVVTDRSTDTIKTTDGTAVEFVKRELTYSSGSLSYRARILARATGQYATIFIFAAKSEQFNDADWNTAKGDATLSLKL